jgi:hypothetical protein
LPMTLDSKERPTSQREAAIEQAEKDVRALDMAKMALDFFGGPNGHEVNLHEVPLSEIFAELHNEAYPDEQISGAEALQRLRDAVEPVSIAKESMRLAAVRIRELDEPVSKNVFPARQDPEADSY